MSIRDQFSMFYKGKPVIFERAKMVRKNMAESEKKLWESLKRKQVMGLRFWAQHPIDIFIADFYCHPLRLVIEVDGGIHKSKAQAEYDLGLEVELDEC